MPLTTRVWSAASCSSCSRRAGPDLRRLCRGIDAGGAASARGRGAGARRQDGQRRDGGARGVGPDAEGRGRPQRRPQGSRRPGRRAGPGARRPHATAAQRPGLAERRPARRRRCRRSSANPSARRSCGWQQDGFGVGTSRGDPLARTTPPDTVVAQNPPATSKSDTMCRCSSIAANAAPRYVMPDLIGVNGDRAADLLRSRGFRVAVVGDQPYPGVPAGHRAAAEPAGGLPDRAGRADLARGEPVSVSDRAVDPVGRLRRARRRDVATRASAAAPT